MVERIEDKGKNVAKIINDAGGKVVGRTRLQKMAYLLEVAGFGVGFSFDYQSYGPYSEELSRATVAAEIAGLVLESDQPTPWGGRYSVYNLNEVLEPCDLKDKGRCALLSAACNAGLIALELAATAVFFARSGNPDPWAETRVRKPDKADDGRLAEARSLYEELRKFSGALPSID